MVYHCTYMNIILLLWPKTLRTLLLWVGVFAAFMLSSALIGQYGFDLHPCDLCIYQRYPYLAIIIVSLLGGWVIKSPQVVGWLLLLCVALLFVDTGIAFYHTGVEYGWFLGPDACSNDASGEMTLEQMRAAIRNAPLVTCAQAMAYIFGLSMAAWNAAMAFAVAIATLMVRRKIK